MVMEEEEYELIAVSPLRKMEKRIDRLEKGGSANDMVKELIEVVRTNQRIVDEVVKINSEMINRVSDLSTNVSKMTEKMNNFLEKVEITELAPQEKEGAAAPAPVSADVDQRIQKLEKRINAMLLTAMKAKQMPQRPVNRQQFQQ
jgi:DNA anti-recombination protein RmuC